MVWSAGQIDRRLVLLLEDLAQLVRLVFARDDEVVDIVQPASSWHVCKDGGVRPAARDGVVPEVRNKANLGMGVGKASASPRHTS